MHTQGEIVEAREAALGAYLTARRLADDGDGAAFEGAMATFRTADAKHRRVAGITGPIDYAGMGLADGSGGPRFPAGAPRGALTGGNERSWRLGARTAQSFVEHGQRFGAELTTSGNVPVTVPIRREPIADPRAARFVADIIPEEDAPGGRFAFWRQTVRTNNAAVVPRGTRKPTSVFTGAKVTDEVEVIAHLSEPIYRFDLEDAPMLQSFVDAELEYGLRTALDDEIVTGDGTGSHFAGLINQASGTGFAGTMLGTTRLGITELEEIDVFPTHFLFSPAMWAAIEEEASETFSALPAFSPLDATARRLHGLGVVVSNAIPANTALVGDFLTPGYITLHRTGNLRIDWSENIFREDLGDTDPGTDFERNMIVFRAEMRAMLAIGKPAAFRELDLVS